MKMPLWFRAVVAGLFAILLTGYLLVRGPVGDRAFARTTTGSPFDAVEPALRFERSRADKQRLPPAGAYRFNGMLVRYSTYPEKDPAKRIGELEKAFRKTGYKTARKQVNGDDTVVAVHPKTKVLLTAVALHLPGGYGAVRLAQRNLGELKADYVAEISGVPRLASAIGGTLITSIDGPPVETLTYVTNDSVDWIEQFYLREMSLRGWQPLVQPMNVRTNGFATLFFSKDGEELSVVVASTPAGSRMVMVNHDKPGRRS